MKLNLKEFSKVKSTPHMTTLKHKDGHILQMNHGVLAPKIRGELASLPEAVMPQGYADGGDVEGSEELEPAPTTAEPDTEVASPGSVNVTASELSPNAKLNIKSQKSDLSQAIDEALAENQARENPSPEDSANNLAKAMGKPIPFPSKTPNVRQTSQESFQGPANMPQEAPQTQIPMDPGTQAILESGRLQQQGILGEAAAQGSLGTKESSILQSQAQAQADAMQRYKQHVDSFNQERQNLLNDVKNGHIDPHQFWEDKSVPGKISTAIGLILGGISSGITGKDNPALMMLNNQIERNIQAQRFNLGNKFNLLSANRERFQDETTALNATRVMLGDQITSQLQSAAAKSKDPMAQARAVQMIGQVQQQMAPYLSQMYLRQTMLGGQAGQGGNPDKFMSYLRMADPKQYETMQKSYIPGAGFAAIDVPDKVREEISTRKALQNAVGDLRDFAQKHSGSMVGPIAVQGATKAKLVQDLYRRANGQGVFREAEANFVNNIVNQNPTSFLNKWKVDPQYRALEDANNSELGNLFQSYGVRGMPNSTRPMRPSATRAISFRPMKAR